MLLPRSFLQEVSAPQVSTASNPVIQPLDETNHRNGSQTFYADSYSSATRKVVWTRVGRCCLSPPKVQKNVGPLLRRVGRQGTVRGARSRPLARIEVIALGGVAPSATVTRKARLTFCPHLF